MFWTVFWGVIAALIVLPLIMFGMMKVYLFFDQRRTPAGNIDWLGVLSIILLGGFIIYMLTEAIAYF